MMIYLFMFSAFGIFWAMLGYPISIFVLDKLIKNKVSEKSLKQYPTVTVLIVAHNEKKVIRGKLENLLLCDYPRSSLEILVSSDNSTDGTNDIVKEVISEHPEFNISLFEVTERKGKINAQNEAQKLIKTEYMIMTDANSLFDINAIGELVSSFTGPDIAYVCGQLKYSNDLENLTSDSESTYWNLDLYLREVESKIQTITAGNGALYACRTCEYINIALIKSHDSTMPLEYALAGRKAKYNKNAIAYEKAGANLMDEFSRKVRMNRIVLSGILPSVKILNIFKYKWFTYFYLGHRTARYLLWLNHIILFISSLLLFSVSPVFKLIFVIQCIVYLLGLITYRLKLKNKIMRMINYYCVAILAQIFGVAKSLTGKSKATWEKAESTR